mmetsp:Transcript_44881/g.113101  ORF Transcript_44881/g.113101 Transcript_44881/m.113101 type:complete len:186 (-) Transcript_44881:155-712(-)
MRSTAEIAAALALLATLWLCCNAEFFEALKIDGEIDPDNLPPGYKKELHWFSAEGPANMRLEGIPEITQEAREKIKYAEFYFANNLQNDHPIVEFAIYDARLYHNVDVRSTPHITAIAFFDKDDDQVDWVDTKAFNKRQVHLLLMSRGMVTKEERKRLRRQKREAKLAEERERLESAELDADLSL